MSFSNRPYFNHSISDNFSSKLQLYLNNASRSPLPISHKALITQYMNEWMDGTHDPYNYNFKHSDQLKVLISKFIQCSPTAISMQFNVASSFANIIQGIDWKSTDEILLFNDDYPSITLPFQTIKQASIKWINPVDGALTLNSLKAAISSKSRYLCLSWVQYKTGQVINMNEISKLCQEHGIMLLVDATQALGVIPVNLSTINIDFFTASLYKWCFCPQGTAISVFSEKLLSTLPPMSAGVFSQVDRSLSAQPLNTAKSAQKFEFGNLNILGIMLAHETFLWFHAIGIESINQLISKLSQKIVKAIQRKGYALSMNYPNNHNSGIVSFFHSSPDQFMNKLAKHNGSATYRDGLIRLSPGMYQDDSTITALESIL